MKYVVANWKMGPATKEKAEGFLSVLAKELRHTPGNVEVVLCPPFVWLPFARNAVVLGSRFRLGAQDAFWEDEGARTGEISVSMLRSLGVSFVLVGHSERRALGETNEIVAQKLRMVVGAGLTAVLCVGETSRQGAASAEGGEPRPAGAGRDWHAFLREEVESAFGVVDSRDAKRLVVAYEPVWAIGREEPDTPDDALTAALFIRKIARARFGARFAETFPVLYGGSVFPENVRAFARQDGIDGVLVGRSSLDAEKFSAIVREFVTEEQ